MSDWSTFTDDEISILKHSLGEKFERGMKWVLYLTPLFIAISPYIPGRKGRALIDSMSYGDAILRFGIVWVISLMGLWLWYYYRLNKQFDEYRVFLKKKKMSTIVKSKSKSTLSRYDNQLTTDLEDKLKTIKISKEESSYLKVGDSIEIEYEDKTKIVFNIEKI